MKKILSYEERIALTAALAKLVEENGAIEVLECIANACNACADVSDNRSAHRFNSAAEAIRKANHEIEIAEHKGESLATGLSVLADDYVGDE